LDLNFGVNDHGDSAIVVLDYVADLFLRSTAERMMCTFSACRAGGGQSGWRLRDFSLLSGSERQQILVDWNNTSAPYPSTQTIPAASPHSCPDGDAIALRSPQGQLTYSELNQQSNRLAHRLRKSGSIETPVAILMERSVQTVVASLLF